MSIVRRGVPRIALAVLFLVLVAACGGDGTPDAGPTEAAGDGQPTTPAATAAEPEPTGTATAGGGGDGDQPTVTISTLSGGMNAVALRVITENGFDRDHGFVADAHYQDPASSMQFFLQEGQVAFDHGPDAAAVARTRGFDLTLVWGTLPNNVCILVLEDSPYESVQDLRGERVGHFGVDSGTTAALSVLLANYEDIDIFEEFELVEGNPPGLVELLKQGEVEAIFDFVPHTSRAIVEGPARCLYGPISEEWSEQADGSLYLAGIMVHDEWARENPELAQGVIDAWDDAYRWIVEDPTRITQEPYTEIMGADDPEVLELIAEQVESFPIYASQLTDADIEAANRFIDLLAEQGVVLEENPQDAVAPLSEVLER